MKKVWNRSEPIAGEKVTALLLYGKPKHEETRATLLRIASANAPSVVVNDMEEAVRAIHDYITGCIAAAPIYKRFFGPVF